MSGDEEQVLLGRKKRYPFVVAVHWFVFNSKGEVLLLRRAGSGYMDGYYSVPAGHVDGDETVKEAMLREITEEVGVALKKKDIIFEHVMHRNQQSEKYERIDFFFVTKNFTGKVANCEPKKCDELVWVSPNEIPKKTVEYVAKALENVMKKVRYSEHAEK